jgi:L-asparagine transporter-like permease
MDTTSTREGSSSSPTIESPTVQLQRTLGHRQIAMIAIGGVIGAGLFVGSGAVIASAGPAVLLAYAGIGAVLVLIMRMLGELATQSPDSGSFATYATRELGPWAGSTVSSLYMYTWMVTIGFEAVVAAGILNDLAPALPSWTWALLVMAVFTGVNMVTAKVFGEVEFWFSLIKVVTIVLFIVVGIIAILGGIPNFDSPGLGNVTDDFVPHGWNAVWLATVIVFFSFFGSETVSIAAAESPEPAVAVRRAIRTVLVRLLTFYIGSVLVVVLLLPASDARLTADGPYVAVLRALGLPAAAGVLKIVVLCAILSLLNSGIYVVSRMLFAAARRGEMPAMFGQVSSRGVPARAVMFASTGGFAVVAANYWVPGTTLFTFLLNSSGALAVAVYGFIIATHLASRRRMTPTDVSNLTVKAWGSPVLPIFTAIVLISVLAALAYDPAGRESLYLSGLATLVAFVTGAVVQGQVARSKR